MNKNIFCAAVLVVSALAWAAKPKPTDAGYSITGAVDEYDTTGRAYGTDAGIGSSGASTGSTGSALDTTGGGGNSDLSPGMTGGGTSGTDTTGTPAIPDTRGSSMAKKDAGTSLSPRNNPGTGSSVDDLDTPTLTPERNTNPSTVPPSKAAPQGT